MDLRDLTKTLLRRWYLTIPLVIMAVAASAGVWQQVGTAYEVTSSMVLIPPPAVVDAQRESQAGYAPRNPLFYLGGLGQARDVILASASTESFTQEMLANYRATVTLSGRSNSAAPILVVDVSSSSYTGAAQCLSHVLNLLPQRTDSLQESMGVATRDRVTLMRLSPNMTPKADHKQQLEFAVAVCAFVLALGGLSVAVLDARLSQRGSHPEHRRRGSRAKHRMSDSGRAFETEARPADSELPQQQETVHGHPVVRKEGTRHAFDHTSTP